MNSTKIRIATGIINLISFYLLVIQPFFSTVLLGPFNLVQIFVAIVFVVSGIAFSLTFKANGVKLILISGVILVVFSYSFLHHSIYEPLNWADRVYKIQN